MWNNILFYFLTDDRQERREFKIHNSAREGAKSIFYIKTSLTSQKTATQQHLPSWGHYFLLFWFLWLVLSLDSGMRLWWQELTLNQTFLWQGQLCSVPPDKQYLMKRLFTALSTSTVWTWILWRIFGGKCRIICL